MPRDQLQATTAAGLLAMLDPGETRTGTVRFPFAVGIFAKAELVNAVAYGRSLGLDVQVHKGSGWLIQRGYLVATGPGQDLYRLVDRLATTVEWSDQ